MKLYVLLAELHNDRWAYVGEHFARDPKTAVETILRGSKYDVRYITGLRVFECSDITGSGDYDLDHEYLYDGGFEIGSYPKSWGGKPQELQ